MDAVTVLWIVIGVNFVLNTGFLMGYAFAFKMHFGDNDEE